MYNLAKDRTETSNLVKEHSEKVKSMAEARNRWWKEMTGEMPKQNATDR